MKRNNLGALVALNVALLLVLGVLCLTPRPAEAQRVLGGSEYVMIAGQSQGQTNRTVYVVEVNSGRMIAVTYDNNRRTMIPLASRDIRQDIR